MVTMAKIALVSSPGGRLTEILALRAALKEHHVVFVTQHSEQAAALARTECVYQLDARGARVWPLVKAFGQALWIYVRERPQAVVSTGAEIAVPFFYAAWLLGIPTIFVESAGRTHSPSCAGRWVYPIARAFFVQWETLAAVYGPKACYRGGLL
jgi:beta-1,4-N-acetylglucosaminyltransferase